MPLEIASICEDGVLAFLTHVDPVGAGVGWSHEAKVR